jgi:CHAT domain-containing protein
MTTLDKSFRKGFLQTGDKERVYRRLASLLIDEGRIPEANHVLDLLKEEEYFEYVRGENPSTLTDNISGTESEKSMEENFTRISEHITERGAELAAIRTKAKNGELSDDEKSREKEILSDLEIASRSFEAFIDEVSEQLEKKQGRRAAELTEHELRDLKSLQSTLKALGDDTVVVHYLVADDMLAIILTTSETQVAREVKVSSTDLNRMIADLRRDLMCPQKDPRPKSKKVYETVIAPIARDLEQAHAKTLLLSLDGALRYVPFYCLHDGDKYLIERYTAVVFTPASRDKLGIHPAASWTVAGFGVAGKVNENFIALPSVKYELNGIVRQEGSDGKGILPGTVRIDGDFTAEAMRSALDRAFTVIHIASHFVFRPTDKDSFLLLGDGSRLTLDRIKHQGFRFDAVDLLTLSACETGLGSSDANGREIEGFGVLAQRSGAKGVIATLWSVADMSTGLLMRRMYEIHAKGGINKAEALRRAQLELLRGEQAKLAATDEVPEERGSRERYCERGGGPAFEENPSAPFAHPFFWAPFILMGNYL